MKQVFIILLLFIALPAYAHEVRPAYLDLQETNAGEFNVLWKTPMRGDMRLSLSPEFSGKNVQLTPITTYHTDNAAVQTWQMKVNDPLQGQTINIAGLEATMTDALVRVRFADGTSWTQRLTPSHPAAVIPVQQGGISVAGVYFKLGVEHILLGIDHLLFVLALLFIARGTWRLVKTVTAFTIAHSITLALATLGFIHLPPAPVEAVIALSIVFVAVEIIRGLEGHHSITASVPWIVAFIFGLLHGLGFAGALCEIGLPANHIPLVLLFFNLGVEAGQLLFIAVVISFMIVLHRIRIAIPRWVNLLPPYAIGSVAMFWVMQRIAAF
jgi:hydrogenase/urease accessory protein HupE